MSELNKSNIQSINDCIRKMLEFEDEFKELGGISYDDGSILNWSPERVNGDVIRDAFRHCPHPECPCKFSKKDIYRRLVLIDSLYFTNVNRMRSFGLEEMTDVIWDLGKDTSGKYSDVNLVNELRYVVFFEEFKNDPERGRFFDNLGIGKRVKIEKFINDAFKSKYGYIDGCETGEAMTLLSIYFHYVSLVYVRSLNVVSENVTYKNDYSYGFPIYDRLVCSLINPIEKYIGISPLTTNINDIYRFMLAVKNIVTVLAEEAPNLWEGKCKFELFDYFVRNISKAGEGNYKSLLTKYEYIHNNKTRKPIRIQEWEDKYNEIMGKKK